MGEERFAGRLRRHRQAAGLTQEALAERSGLSVRGISDLERGVKQRPHAETVRLLAEALDMAPAELDPPIVAPARSSLVLTPVPRTLTPLVDREQDVDMVVGLLHPDRAVRLVTLTGSGGVGKTRLASHVATMVAGDFADGVAFVSLAEISDPDLVMTAIAQALGMRETGGDTPLHDVTKHLRDRQVLLVLDNVEHVLAAARDIAALLLACERCTILATSRSPLHISGEHDVPVGPLALPQPTGPLTMEAIAASPAVTLFVQRAQAVQPRFTLASANAAAVAGACAQVDGVPLALELAAVRMKMLSPQEIESLLGNRLGVLTGGHQDAPLRHRTMRLTIAWSCDLLQPDQQAALNRLAVFAGGATWEAATTVVAAGDAELALDQLTALLDQSLIQRVEMTDGTPRFVMLETIREYALEQLADSDEAASVRDRFTAYFLALAEQGETELAGSDQVAWMARLEAESSNLRVALGWATHQADAETAQRMVSALWRFWATSGRIHEARDWMDKALALAPEHHTAALARAYLRRGNIAIDLADYLKARSAYQASHAIYRELGDTISAGRALGGLGLVCLSLNDLVAAREAAETTLALWHAEGKRPEVASAMHNLGRVQLVEGNFQAARESFAAAHYIWRIMDDDGGIAWAACWRGRVDRLDGRFDDARRWLSRARAGFLEIGDILGIATTLSEFGCLALAEGDGDAALSFLLDALRDLQASGDVLGMLESAENLADVAASRNHPDVAVMIASAIDAWHDERGVPISPEMEPIHRRLVAELRLTQDPAAFALAWEEGQFLSLDEAVSLAFRLVATA